MILSREDTDLFFRLMWGLQFYVNQQLHLVPDVQSREAYSHLASKDKITVRDALWKNPDLIAAYCEQNPDGLSPEESAIVRKWKGFIAGKFYVFRYLKDYAVFLGGSKVYGVLGLYDRLDDVLDHRPVPVMIETVLLAYKDTIIYDGLCRPYNVVFGGGIRSGLEEQYQAAKQNRRIITSLEPETASGKQLPQRREPGKDSEAAVDEITQAAERLRGGTAIQGAAFGLLRASAKVAQAAVQSPDDLEALVQPMRQVHNALSRLQKVFERAE